jgi:raffinose/stachyose/melibiose transport system permease protein
METFRRNWKVALLFMLPALLLYTVFMFVPVFQSTLYAFSDWNGFGELKVIGIKGFINLFGDENFFISLKNNILLLISSVFLIIPVALLLAVIISREIRGYKFFRTAYFMPQVLSTVVVSLIWSFIYNPQFGLLNAMLKLMGLEGLIKLWLADRKIAIFSVLCVNAWYYIGYIMIILLSSINGIQKEYYEAADIDGASGWTKLVHIILPLIWDTVKVTVLLGIAGSMKAFDLVYILTKGGPGHSTELMATYMYKQAFISFNYGYGSTISLMILFMSLILSLLMKKIMKKEDIEL